MGVATTSARKGMHVCMECVVMHRNIEPIRTGSNEQKVELLINCWKCMIIGISIGIIYSFYMIS